MRANGINGGDPSGARRERKRLSPPGDQAKRLKAVFCPEATGEGTVYAGSTVDGTTTNGSLEDGCRAQSQTWPSRSDPAWPSTLNAERHYPPSLNG